MADPGRRVLVVPLASPSPVLRAHVAALERVLAAAGRRVAVRPARLRMPAAPPPGAPLAALAWVAAYPVVQAARGMEVLAAARRGDVVLLFLGAHHLPAALAARARGARVVFVPGGLPSQQAAAGAGRAVRAAVRVLERAVMRASDVVVMESAEETRALPPWVEARAGGVRGVGVPARVVPWVEREHVVAFVSRFEPHKGALAFAGAARLAGPGDPVFAMAGSGSLAPALGALASPRLDVKGWLPDAEKDALLARAKLLVLPSSGEGVPTVVLEAMARGTPVLATPVGGVPAVVLEGKTGFTLEEATPRAVLTGVRRALADPGIERIAARARALAAAEYSLEAGARRYAGLLASLG